MISVRPRRDAKKGLSEDQQLAAGRRRRKAREALTGYLFVLPATLATFVFGLWPVIAGFYESLKSGSPLTNKYVGLDNYLRALGSLTFILLLAAALALLYVAYRAWRDAVLYRQINGGNPWYHVIPGLLVGASLITLAFNFVTGTQGDNWVSVLLLVLAAGGFVTADYWNDPPDERDPARLGRAWIVFLAIGALWIGGPRLLPDGAAGVVGWAILLAALAFLLYRAVQLIMRIRTGRFIGTAISMGTLTLAGILLLLYTVDQMDRSTQDARSIAARIFNPEVANAAVLVNDQNAVISGLSVDGETRVKVMVGGKEIEAPLAPDAFSELPAERITRLQTALANNQKVQVVLPDGTVAEGQITGLAMGEKLDLNLLAEKPQVAHMENIYTTAEVGENAIAAAGRTEPVRKQIGAALVVFLGLATVYTMSWVRGQASAEDEPRIHRWLSIGRIAMGLAVAAALLYLLASIELSRQAAAAMNALSDEQFQRAYQYVTGKMPRATLRSPALAAELLYWPQVFLVAVGGLLIGAAYLVWQSAQRRESKLGFGLTILLALLMMVGGWLLISELPRTITLAGREARDTYDATVRTAMYSVGTVPVQLALGLFLAYLLFSEVKWGKSLFRVIYFMPYIAPSVATSTVFLVIFSLNNNSLANQVLGVAGVEPLRWLKEPTGIVRIFYQEVLGGDPLNIPTVLQGPSLALFTVILYNIWVFAGYNAVIFLAGLGSIPPELYEAAEVDGAGRWARFRNITLPLLSPTTFFLSMLSIIGTFKAFTHIYVLRGQAVGKEIDTMSVHIFQQLYAANDPGYAAALAFTLFGMILVLTLVQNRLTREQVFYG